MLIVFSPCFYGCTGAVGSTSAPPNPPPISVTLQPPSASVSLGATQQFTATISNSTNSVVSWSVNGISGGNSAVGSISSNGLYTAPQILPQPATVTVRATSQADPTASAPAVVTITSGVAISITPVTANVELGALQSFVAHVSGSAGTSVNWSLAGVGCSGASCGSVDSNGNYIAPSVLPSPASVTLTARSVSDPSESATASITVTSHFTFTVSGPTTVNAGAMATYAATLTPAANSNPSTAITWSVSGTGCTGAICGTLSSSGATVVYQAPTIAPSPNLVTLMATPVADPSKAYALAVTITGGLSVTVMPAMASVGLGGSQLLTAQITGSANMGVMWDVNGIVGGNTTVGTVNTVSESDTAVYTAPASLPSPPTVVVHATSAANRGVSGQSIITITNAAAIAALLPASAFAGGTGGFTLRVQGENFIDSSPGLGSVIVAGGTPRTTSCDTSGDCTTALTAADIAVAGDLTVQIQNPDATFSNVVNFVVAQQTTLPDTIPLTAANPSVSGKDITVVEPSTAGSAAPQSNVTIAIAAMGIYSVTAGSCSLGAGSLALGRPASGASTVDICVFSVSGLDPSFTYSLTGPVALDVTIIGRQPLGLGIVDLTLSILSSALPGPRSLFVQNSNNDTAVATGALVVQ